VAATLASEEYATAVHGAAYSLRDLQEHPRLTLDQKVQAILRRASVVPFDVLAVVARSTAQSAAPPPDLGSDAVDFGSDDDDGGGGGIENGSSRSRRRRSDSGVLVAAAKHGVLVRGCWVVKSAALFARGGGGAEAASLAACHPPGGVPLAASAAALSASSAGSGGGGGGSGSGGATSTPSSGANAPPAIVLTAAEQCICDARDSMLSLLERDGYLYRAPFTAALANTLTDFQARYINASPTPTLLL
jgi:hypothetical protein